jgi:DNA-directed RNA polymerase specialized sigma24 family protein
MWTTALNLLYARKKHEGLGSSLREEEGVALLEAARDPAAHDGTVRLAERERSVAIRFAIELVSDRDREILDLVYFQGCGTDGAAELLGIRRDSAKARLVRARRSLTRKLCSWRTLLEEP